MFVTFGVDGRPAARPMHVARVEEDSAEIWFFSGRGGSFLEELKKEAELKKEPVVLLAFQNDSSAYLSVRGRARIEHDKSRAKELWKEPYTVWFPQGPEDPDIALVAVEMRDAEYWDNRGMNRLEYLFEAAKAYVKRQKPEVIDADQHAKAIL